MTQMTQMSTALRKGPQIGDLCHLRHLWSFLRQLPDFLLLSQRSLDSAIFFGHQQVLLTSSVLSVPLW